MSGHGRTESDRHDEALALLDREREALIGGALEELASIVAAREALVSELLEAAMPPPQGFLDAMRGKAERNGRLMLAALSGLRTARERVVEIDRASRSLKTYTAKGEALNVAPPEASRDERR